MCLIGQALLQVCSDVLVPCVTIIIDGILTSNAEYSATVLVLVIINLELHIHGLHITHVQSTNLKAIFICIITGLIIGKTLLWLNLEDDDCLKISLLCTQLLKISWKFAIYKVSESKSIYRHLRWVSTQQPFLNLNFSFCSPF